MNGFTGLFGFISGLVGSAAGVLPLRCPGGPGGGGIPLAPGGGGSVMPGGPGGGSIMPGGPGGGKGIPGGPGGGGKIPGGPGGGLAFANSTVGAFLVDLRFLFGRLLEPREDEWESESLYSEPILSSFGMATVEASAEYVSALIFESNAV